MAGHGPNVFDLSPWQELGRTFRPKVDRRSLFPPDFTCFENFKIRIWDLFRISIFEFRIFFN